jgi:hypothetical protein
MEIYKRNMYIIDLVKNKINNYYYLLSTRKRPQDFSRNRKMNFADIIMCMLNFFKKDAQIEVDDFLKKVKRCGTNMTEQAFLKARAKIVPEAFTILNDVLVGGVYKETEYFHTFKGYRLLAVDGSVITLNNTKVMQDSFGYVETQKTKHAQAQASCLYDVENGIILHSIIDSYKSYERKLAIEHIKKLEKLGLRNDLILFDRGYPSTGLLTTLVQKNVRFLMRVSSMFLKEVNGFNEKDGVVAIKPENGFIDLRVINVVLSTGEVEKLITNVFDKDFASEDFKHLYFKRWGIETRYDFLKNKIEIENCSGDSKQFVCQDFYATIFLSNMCELVKDSSDELIKKENSEKELKREYKTNQKRLIGKLKDNLIKIILEENPIKKNLLYDQLVDEIHKKSIPISPKRSFPRVKKGTTVKYPKNKKRSL